MIACSNVSRFLSLPEHEFAAAQNTVVSSDIGRPAIGKPRLFGWAERDLERVDDPVRDVVLDLEDIGQIAVVAVGPEMRAVGRVDELRRDPHAIAGAADRAFEHRAHAKLAADGCGCRPSAPCR